MSRRTCAHCEGKGYIEICKDCLGSGYGRCRKGCSPGHCLGAYSIECPGVPKCKTCDGEGVMR